MNINLGSQIWIHEFNMDDCYNDFDNEKKKNEQEERDLFIK